MMDIVVAVNEYSPSGTATEWISNFLDSTKISGTVHFVYCVSDQTEVVGDTFQDSTKSSDEGQDIITEHSSLAEEYGVTSESHIVHSETPEEGILSVVDDVNPEFIVTGHRTYTSEHDSLYSTAQSLLHKSPVPVTVVSSHCSK